MSKNISNLSGRIGLKDNLFKQISENTLSKEPKDIKEIAKKNYRDREIEIRPTSAALAGCRPRAFIYYFSISIVLKLFSQKINAIKKC